MNAVRGVQEENVRASKAIEMADEDLRHLTSMMDNASKSEEVLELVAERKDLRPVLIELDKGYRGIRKMAWDVRIRNRNMMRRLGLPVDNLIPSRISKHAGTELSLSVTEQDRSVASEKDENIGIIDIEPSEENRKEIPVGGDFTRHRGCCSCCCTK